MDAQQLIARMLAQRESWVELSDGAKVVKVKVRRPAESEFKDFFVRSGGQITSLDAGLVHAQKYVTGWEGVTEATLLGEAIGASDPLEFSSEVWSVLLADRMAWVEPIAQKLVDSIVEHTNRVGEARKNSSPTSTPAPESSGKASA